MVVVRLLLPEYVEQPAKLRGREPMTELLNLSLSEGVASFVVRVSCVSLEPMPGHLMFGRKFIELTPEVIVLDRLLFDGAPAARFPPLNPGRDSVAEIPGVGEQLDLARLLQGPERGDGSLKFHPVIGGGGFAPGNFPDVSTVPEHGRPAAGPRIPLATAVRVNDDFLHRTGGIVFETSPAIE